MQSHSAASGSYFGNQFLVAMPSMEDEHFNQSVTLLCEHNPEGALGLIVNRPTELTLSTMLQHMGLDHIAMIGDPPIYWGGPVQPERGFVLHDQAGDWETTLPVNETLFMTSSRDILAAIGQGAGPANFMVALGYAGWTAGQLESEILGNSWLNTPVDQAILFHTPAVDRWQAASRLLGLDIHNLAGRAGHA